MNSESMEAGLQNNSKQDADLDLMGIIYALSSDIRDLYSINVNTKKVTVYRSASEATGISGKQSVLSYDTLFDLYIKNDIYPDDKEPFRKFVQFDRICDELKTKENVIIHYRVIRNGEKHHLYLKCARVGGADDFENIIYAFALEDTDISRQKMLRSMERDELTDIYNRKAFYIHAQNLLDENQDTDYDIIMADVANFKLVNSIYGEGKGDELLKYLAKCFERLTEGGICARYGGDQFVVLCNTLDTKDKNWFRDKMAEITDNSPVQNVVIKYGIYRKVDRNITVSVMCDRALLAVKSIKHNYTKPYATYDGPVSRKHLQTQLFETSFDKALANEEFVVWYQPKYDAATEKIVGAEALVRWQMEDGTFVSPAEFIPVFEENGLIVKLDEYVFRKVCESVKEWMDKGANITPISVNLSRASLHYEGTVDNYKSIVKEYDVPPMYVPIELTESATVYSEHIKDLMEELKDAGFQLHMDDFGSGVSSLASFNILPFDVVKLDKSLIDYIGDLGGDELLKHTIELAHFKKMKVVAEGVEEKEQLDFLDGLGCDMIQGFYFSPPKSYEDTVKYFQANNVY